VSKRDEAMQAKAAQALAMLHLLATKAAEGDSREYLTVRLADAGELRAGYNFRILPQLIGTVYSDPRGWYTVIQKRNVLRALSRLAHIQHVA